MSIKKTILLACSALICSCSDQKEEKSTEKVLDTSTVKEELRIDSNKVYEYLIDETNSYVVWSARENVTEKRVHGQINLTEGVIKIKGDEVVYVDFTVDMPTMKYVGIGEVEASDSLIEDYIKKYSFVKDYLHQPLRFNSSIIEEVELDKGVKVKQLIGQFLSNKSIPADIFIAEKEVDFSTRTVRVKLFDEVRISDSIVTLPSVNGDIELTSHYWVDINLVGNIFE